MFTKHRTKIVAGIAAVLVVVGGGGAALAATGALSPREESRAILGDAAEQLGVETSELTAALKQALKNRVDAAVEAGRLTEEQGEQLRARIDADEVPLLGLGPGGGPGHHHRFGHGAELDAAASFLGVTAAELRTALQEGRTLAEVAEDEGKSVEGLVDAMVAATDDLEQAVEEGRLTEARKDSIVATLEERITGKVNGELGPRRGFRGFGPPPGSGSSSDAAASTA